MLGSKYLAGTYAFFSLCLLASGVIAVVFSQVFHKTDVLLNMVFSSSALTGGLVLGVGLLITWLLSVFAIVQRNHVTIGLVCLNWVLIIDACIVFAVGTAIWFWSLRQRNEFHTVYEQLPAASRIYIQDKFSCCGYFAANDTLEVGGTFCTSQDFANSLPTNNTANFCVTPVTTFTDYALENTFTSIYGFMAVVILLFMASLCVIKERNEIERFKKIDAKRGGRGFV